MMNNKHLKGLIAAPFTPFDKDGSVNLKNIPEYANRLKKDGVSGAFVCGSSGEGLLMTTEERKAVLETWVPFADENFKLIAHIGSTSYEISRDLARHAESLGVYAIGCMGPCYFQPKTAIELAKFCAKVASAAPNTPFYYYHIPGGSGVNVNMVEFLKEAGRVIPNLAGIKYTNFNLMEMFQCLEFEDNKYDILHGHDELLICGLTLGAQAAIGTTFNFMAPVFNKIIEAFRNKDIEKARAIQKNANEIISIMLATGSPVSGGKAMMKICGLDCGPCREPLGNLTDKQYEKLKEDLKKSNFFDLVEEAKSHKQDLSIKG
ncbi:MAG: dihydrodipicolinate synthase family protein [Bacteroidales bacterium]|nr:dihydrodipicolinate synthase family protein [Bacteroidales bacterium]